MIYLIPLIINNKEKSVSQRTGQKYAKLLKAHTSREREALTDAHTYTFPIILQIMPPENYLLCFYAS